MANENILNLSENVIESYTTLKTKLQDAYSKLNPFILQNMMKKKIHAIVKQTDPLPRYRFKKDIPTPEFMGTFIYGATRD